MNTVAVVGLSAATVLAFANGANDISKSIATLVGQIALAWVVTLPSAGFIGVSAYWILTQTSKLQ